MSDSMEKFLVGIVLAPFVAIIGFILWRFCQFFGWWAVPAAIWVGALIAILPPPFPSSTNFKGRS